MPTDALLFGRGVAFPPRLDADGRFGWAVGPRSVRESIRIILTTEPGERVMLPGFGAGLRAVLFEPNVPATHRLIEERVLHALRRWEPRIAVEAVVVGRHPRDPGRATVAVSYRLVATATRESVDLSVAVGGGGAT
ncbi:GPW/gp25 family protein [Geodermatophilus sp. SYSU D00804]